METLSYAYDRVLDVLTVEGVKYSGEFFRSLAFYRELAKSGSGRVFRFRVMNGEILTIEAVTSEAVANSASTNESRSPRA